MNKNCKKLLLGEISQLQAFGLDTNATKNSLSHNYIRYYKKACECRACCVTNGEDARYYTKDDVEQFVIHPNCTEEK